MTGLLSVFFGWLQSSRCDAQYRRRKRDCTRFARFEYEGGRVADMPRLTVEGADALPPAARYDVDQFRRWGIEAHVRKRRHRGAARQGCPPDLLRAYHATGARASEPRRAAVADYLPQLSHVVLRSHKTARPKAVSAAHRQIEEA